MCQELLEIPFLSLSSLLSKDKHSGKTYILFDSLTHNTRGYFASCVVFFRAPKGLGKIREMSKMSARIIC